MFTEYKSTVYDAEVSDFLSRYSFFDDAAIYTYNEVLIPIDRVKQMLCHYYDDTSICDKYIKPMHIGCERCEPDINSFGVPSSVITDIVNNAVNRGKKVEIHTLKSPMPNDDSINLAIYINGENDQ